MSTKIFLHGLESSSQGTKAVFFREKYPDMLTPDFRGSLEERMGSLERILAGESEIRIVGSSFGGLMGTLFAMQNEPRMERLVLLAPAIHMLPAVTTPALMELSIPVLIFHGREDQVIPLEEVRTIASRFFHDLSFHAVDDDHYLHKTFTSIDWDEILIRN